eukprot:c9158_g1_i1.p1 GENE.c9158_g1_i1~~c9158_g1_i1.p1  ORF type:complete len:148 (+),score=33.88 c9158_g1_i1:30-473(+)
MERLSEKLHLMAARGDVNGTLQCLDRERYDVNTRHPETGQTPLHWAAGNDQIYLVRLLLKRGANPNAQDPFKVTPLHCAANSGSVEICESLMAAGASMKSEVITAFFSDSHKRFDLEFVRFQNVNCCDLFGGSDQTVVWCVCVHMYV